MGIYAEKLMDAVRNMTGNSPIKTTSTTTLKQPNEGLDIGSLMMMLMMSSMFKKPAGAFPYSDVANAAGSIVGDIRGGGGTGIGSNNPAGIDPSFMQGGEGGSLDSLMQMLTKIGALAPFQR